MDWDDLKFLRVLREAMRDVAKESNRRQIRHGQSRNLGQLKINKLPKFVRRFTLKKYLD